MYSAIGISVLILIMFFLLVLDSSITKIYYINLSQILSSESKILLFVAIGISCFTCQYLVSRFLKKRIAFQKIERKMRIFYYVNYYSPIIFFSIFLILIIEISIEKYYHTLIVLILVTLSGAFSSTIMISLTKLFSKWFQIERNPVLIIYSTSFILISSSIILSCLITVLYLSNKPDEIRFHYGIINPHFDTFVIELLKTGYSISSIFGFILAWVGTTLMLNQYSIRWKKRIHWLIICVPMLYFLIQFTPLFLEQILNFMKLSPIAYGLFYTLFVSYSQPVGGLIFGGAFWTLSRNLSKQGIKFEFPKIAGYGFILLFITNQLILVSPANYPPFGVITISILPFACFMLFLGIYSSALSISFDIRLKSDIKKLVHKKFNLLLSISSSEGILLMEKGIEDIYLQVSDESTVKGVNTMLSFEED